MSEFVRIYNDSTVAKWAHSRCGEQRVWQSLALLDTRVEFIQALKDARSFGIRYVLLGIPEDIGPRANLGKGGANLGFDAFLQRFLNIPLNHSMRAEELLLLGEVNCADLQQQSEGLNNQHPDDLAKLRALCEQLDQRVASVAHAIFSAGLTPIVIGGGHNNCYPLLQQASLQAGKAINAINFDPHADFRALEGRHSGNGFHYAAQQGYLAQYHVMGLHEQKNNAAIFKAMAEHNATYTSYHTLQVSQSTSLHHALSAQLQAFCPHTPLAIELDVDAITLAPASAFNYQGFTLAEAEHFVYRCAEQPHSCYLHLCEGAPSQDPNGLSAGNQATGQIISALVMAFLRAKQSV